MSYLNYLPDLQSGPRTIVVGMSGGVDSSVAALLLKQQGHNVIGLFMKNWQDMPGPQSEEEGRKGCNAEEDFEDVARVCDKIGIPYYSIEFVKEYWDNVFSDFLKEIEMGLTPNPDILCNREIKFKSFYQKARELGAEFVATGHYCQHFAQGESHSLGKGLDAGKDQTYFLYTMQAEILKNVLFPIGHLQKSKVRDLAREYGLATSDKKDSTGICFIGERKFNSFLSTYLAPKEGEFHNLKGECVGTHHGQQFFTIGQRKGLGLGGQGAAWFVLEKIPEKNIVIVERGEEHPALFTHSLQARQASWVSGRAPESFPFACRAKIRYRQQDQECIIQGVHEGILSVSFPQAQRAVTLGQSVVFYQDSICLGGAFISQRGPSLYDLTRKD